MDFFGLDIGSHTIKIVQLKKDKNKYQLLAFGSCPSPKKGLLSEAETDLASLAEITKRLYQDSGVKTRNVVTALPQDQVFTKLITIPPLSDKEIESAIEWEAERYVPLPLSEVILSYEILRKVKEDNQEKMEILLAASPRALIEKMINVLKMAGLNPVSIEMEIMAVIRSLTPVGGGSFLIADFGAKATDLAVVEGDVLSLIHSIPSGGESLTRAISLELGLDPEQAEAYKESYGADPEKLEGKIGAAIKPVLNNIIEEIKKTIQFYQQKGKNIQRVILTGGGAVLPQLNTLLAKSVNLEVQIGDPFGELIEGPLLAKIPFNQRSVYSIAVGLAMKEI